MSSGTGFITDAVNSLCSSLRACFSAQGASAANTSPTDEAREIILQFVNHSLKKREKVAAVSDLVDNAAGDLVVMALWELVRAKELARVGALRVWEGMRKGVERVLLGFSGNKSGSGVGSDVPMKVDVEVKKEDVGGAVDDNDAKMEIS